MRTGIAIAAAGLLMAGCELFPTRAPSGVEGGGSVWLTPAGPGSESTRSRNPGRPDVAAPRRQVKQGSRPLPFDLRPPLVP